MSQLIHRKAGDIGYFYYPPIGAWQRAAAVGATAPIAGRAADRTMALTQDDLRTRFRAALVRAAGRRVAHPDAALHAFLAASAGYFLGEWLPTVTHVRLMERLLGALPGLGGIAVPADPTHALQLAQHIRELPAELGELPWLEEMTAATAQIATGFDPDPRGRRWDADTGVRCAAMTLAASRDGHPLLLAHARRRLWELAHPGGVGVWRPPSASTVRGVAAIAFGTDPHGAQVLEAALAEMSATPSLAAPLVAALQTSGRRRRPRAPIGHARITLRRPSGEDPSRPTAA